jgi:hypothetical protein
VRCCSTEPWVCPCANNILTKISVNCVINLHAALLFMCLFLWVYPMCGYNFLYIYGYCMYMFTVIFSMNPCIYGMYVFVYVLYIKFCKSYMCICFNCMQFEKFMWHSSVGCWVCYSMFRRENKSIFWSSMAQHGWSRMLHPRGRTYG